MPPLSTHHTDSRLGFRGNTPNLFPKTGLWVSRSWCREAQKSHHPIFRSPRLRKLNEATVHAKLLTKFVLLWAPVYKRVVMWRKHTVATARQVALIPKFLPVAMSQAPTKASRGRIQKARWRRFISREQPAHHTATYTRRGVAMRRKVRVV
jgi:hypothetical protein